MPTFLQHTTPLLQTDIISVFSCTGSHRGAQILGARSPWRINFVIRSSVCNMIHVTVLAPRIQTWLLDCWDVCAPLDLHIRLNVFVTPQQVSHRHHVCISIRRFLHRVIQLVCYRVSKQCIACTFKVACL